MNRFTKSLLVGLLEQENNVKAFFGGGFKPPTKGHFLAVKKALENYPEIDTLQVVIGSGLRDNISQDEAFSTWEIYKKYLPMDKVEIVKASDSPFRYIINYIKDNTDHKSYVIIGTREDNDKDTNDLIQRKELFDKYGDHVEVKNVVTKGEVSGTKAREAAKVSKEQFFQFLPKELSNEEMQTVYNYIQSAIKEGKEKKELLESKLASKIKSKLKFILSALRQEGKETKEAFSKLLKAAKGELNLSDDDKKEIGNQMKDVLKLVGLGLVSTIPGGTIAAILIKLFKAQDLITPSAFKVNETGLEIAKKNMDDYKKSNNPTGKKPRDPYGISQFARELISETSSEDFDYETLIKSLTEFMLDLGLNITPLPRVEFVNDDLDNANNFFGRTAYYEPQYNRIVLYTLNRHPKDVMRSFAHEMIHHLQNRENRLGMIFTQNTNEDAHLTSLEKEAYQKGNIIFRNWTDTISNPKINEGSQKERNELAMLIIQLNNDIASAEDPKSKYHDQLPILKKDLEDAKEKLKKLKEKDKTELTEGRKKKPDPKVGTGKKPKGSGRRLYTDEDPTDTVSIKFSTRQDIIDTLNKSSFKSKSHKRQSQIINLIHQRVRAALGRVKDPKKKKKLQSAFEYIKGRKEASKKKTQRLKKKKLTEDQIKELIRKMGDYYHVMKRVRLKGKTSKGKKGKGKRRFKRNPSGSYKYKTLKKYKREKDAKDLQRAIDINYFGENIDPKAQAKHKGKSAPFGSAYEKVKEASRFKRGNVGARYRAIEKRGKKFYYIQDDPLGQGVRQEFGPYKTKAAALKKMGTFAPAQNYRDITEINITEISINLSNYKGQILPGDVLRAPKGFPLGGKKLEKSLQLKVIKNTREGVNRYKLSLEDSKGKKYSVRNYEMDGEYKGKKLPKWGLIRRAKKNLNEDILSQTDFVLPRGQKVVLQAEEDDYNRGLKVELSDEGGYKINYWYGDDVQVYPVEVEIDGESIKPDAKEVYIKFHPYLKENIKEAKKVHKVIAKGIVFEPKNITINVGDTVEWVNKQGVHNVNGKKSHPRNKNNPESFGNEVGAGWTYKFTFTKPGLYKYHCDPHLSADMGGTIEVKEVLKEGRYDSISNKISSDIFRHWKDNLKKKVNRLEKSYTFEDEELDVEATLTLTPGTNKLNIDGGADSENDFIVVNFDVDPKLLPKAWEEISFNLKDVVRHEMEHLTQGEGFQLKPGKFMEDDELYRKMIDSELLSKAEYFKLEKEVDANLQGMYFRAKKEKRPFKDVINDYLDTQDLTSEEKKEILNLWRKRNKVLSLPIFENEKNMNYKIYSDMDGVITDFEESFKKYSDGMTPEEYESKFGRNEFWKLIDKKGKVGFWVGMPWMSDGKEYWNYISKYDVELLSSPSYSDTSRLGKRLWVRNNLPGIKLNLARAADKQNYAAPNHILIDDRVSNIEQWKSQGGIGILHTSAASTIKQLQKLGL